eukprot:6683214-Prymnesium_polylepis.2
MCIRDRPCPVRYAPLSRPRRKRQPQACALSLRIVIASVQYCRLVCKEHIAHTTYRGPRRPEAVSVAARGVRGGTRRRTMHAWPAAVRKLLAACGQRVGPPPAD